MRPFLAATAPVVLALLGIAGTGATAATPPPDARSSVGALPLIAAQSACFGAASRDPQGRPCRDPSLENFVYPRPASPGSSPTATATRSSAAST